MRVAAGLLAGLLCGALPVLAQSASDGEAVGTRTARVTYVVGSSVYIDAGQTEGLGEGHRIKVVRDGQAIAILTVTYLSTHRASCSVESSSVPIEVGDLVRFATTEAVESPSLDFVPSEAPRAVGRRRRIEIRGRVGVRYLVVKERGSSNEGFSQPALDLRLRGSAVGGSPIDLAVDVRSRRTYRAAGINDDSRTRVYRLAMSWNEGRGLRLTLGRQYSPTLASVNIFDGLMLDLNRNRWSAGFFSGTQPDASDFGYSSSLREHGAYFQIRQRIPGPRRWSFTTGAVGSYRDGEINREFVYFQGLFHSRRLSAYVAQEVDYNRGWKAEAGESTLDATSSFVNLRYKVWHGLTLVGGYDNRRNPRLHRDLVTPETDFDDSFRQGVWVGAGLDIGNHVYMGASARSSSGGTSGEADAYTATLGVRGLTRWGLALRSRSTNYTNDQTQGWLHAVSFGMSPGSRVHVDFFGGIRDDEVVFDPQLDARLTWYGIDLEVTLAQRLFLLLSAERDDGDLEEYDQLYSSLSYLF
jgi:hypothetical protein